MALGFAPALLTHLKVLMEQNYPGTKITPSGYLKLLIENNPSLRISSINGESIDGLKRSTVGGHIRDVKLKSLPRITPDQISDEDNCENDFGFQYSESQLDTPLFSKAGFQLEWSFVERYQQEASRLVSTANPNVSILNEMLEQIMHAVNGLIVNMDRKLLSATNFGVNVTTGLATAKTININGDGNRLDLSDGVIELLSDAQENEFVGDLLMVGSGLFNKYNIAKNALGINGAGINQGALNGYKWYYDIASATPFGGANRVGAFAKGAVGYVDIDRYIAWKSGRHGTSWFAQIMLPVESTAGVAPIMMPFNLQIRELDCPDTAFDGYETRTMGRGYQILISKNFGLWQQPKSAFQSTDRLANNNGSLLYEFSNDCSPCKEYPPEIPPALK
jgi:hypothetical protein